MRKKKGIRWTGTKVLVVLLAVALLVGGVVGGTLAWLIGKSTSVNNTFVVGDIGRLSLSETDQDQKFTIIPGVNISKDPKVTYTPASGSGIEQVDAYVFIKVDAGAGWTVTESKPNTYASSKNFLQWEVESKWVYLDLDSNTSTHSGIFYREVPKAATADPQDFPIIASNTITVSSDITVSDVATVNPGNLTFTAYAVQKDSVGTVQQAWEIAKDAPNP